MTRKAKGGEADGLQFGIPALPATLLGEEPVARAERIAAVQQLVADVFAVAEHHLGSEEARSLWEDVVPSMKRGAKAGTRDAARDDLLLHIYDLALAESGRPPETIPRYLAELLAGKSLEPYSEWKPSSPEAAEKLIRRLLERRRKARSVLAEIEPTILTGPIAD